MPVRCTALLLTFFSSLPILADTPANTVPDFPTTLRRPGPVGRIEDAADYGLQPIFQGGR